MSKQPSLQEAHRPEGAVFTIGHSTLPIGSFPTLLHTYGIAGLADIRMVPRSRHNSQFNADVWRGNLDEKSATIWMRFFGRGDEMIVAERQ